MTAQTETETKAPADHYTLAAAAMAEAEKALSAARKGRSDAQQRADTLRDALDRAQFDLATARQGRPRYCRAGASPMVAGRTGDVRNLPR